MSLIKYRQKRDFKKTDEPKGKKPVRSRKKLLFIIQKHAASHLHYDFRLELNGVLISWAVPKGPSLDPTIKRLAVHVEDHPLEYGSFEGVIPKGEYGGGTVMLWDKGEWVAEDSDPVAAYKKGDLKFTLHAEKCQGRWKLIRINKDDKTWLLIKAKDEFAKSAKNYDITAKLPNSIHGYTMEQIAKAKSKIWHSKDEQVKVKSTRKTSPFPKKISPQLATLADQPPVGKEWLHEIKFDGYRILIIKHNGKTTLYTRNFKDWTKKFLSIAKAANKLTAKNIIIDGELVVHDENHHSNFQMLQNAIKKGEDKSFIYNAFDLMYLDKYNLTGLPLVERKNLLKEIIDKLSAKNILYSDHIVGSGDKLIKKACKLHLEGIISKRGDGLYQQKRSKDWLKIKCYKRQEFIIIGFTNPEGKRQFFGSLLLATYNEKRELVYHGHVGTGFTAQSLEELHKKLSKHITVKMPLKQKPRATGKVTWVKPILVAEIEFTEWTSDNQLRHPSFKGLRSDKKASVIRKEEACHVKR